MFRSWLLSFFLLLMTHFAAAVPAQAVDVATVSFNVTIARSSLVSDEITVEVRVIGTNLNNGTLTPPTVGAAPVTLKKDGADLILLDKSLRSEAEVATFLPIGSYLLRVNNDTVQATLVYTGPSVPSPNISKPAAGSTVPPGPIELQFAACPVCNLVGDTIKAALEDDLGVVLDEETLTSTSASWIPKDAVGDLALPEASDFVARVTHTALRQANTPATGGDSALVFSHRFVQSDEIDFKTGFHSPAGHFCLAANFPAPPSGCKILTDPLLQILDTSGSFSTQVAGHDVDYSVNVGSGGALTGSAAADLDDDGMNETLSTPIKGALRGKSGALRSQLSIALNNMALTAKLKLKLSDVLSVPGNTIAHTQSASGSIGATKIKETTALNGALPFARLGWRLELDIDSLADVTHASLTLEGGRNFPLTATNKFKFASGLSSLKLRSVDKGVRINLKKLTLDDATNPVGVTGGGVSARILGQSATATIP